MPPVIVVAYDPLCGWCFGFGPTLRRLRARFAGEALFRVAMGGLVTGARERMIGLDAPYLMRGLQEVRARTGVKAGPAFFERVLEPGRWISRSEPACRAVRIAREMGGEEAALDVATGLCEAFYGEGRVPDDARTIARVATAAGLDPDVLLDRWSAPEAFAETMAMFDAERARGIVSYPALFLKDERGGLVEVLAGAVSPEDAVAIVERAIER
ncbi:DsbA family protein [Salinarimonas ramus]|uniref:DsbA family protein n=2 Tax=Salinarimonas ramus TaxID=690164 RepID=A0A917V5Y3_9HYPH|nr:DsbA family protein [Salinarimonas ramus]